MYFKQTRVARSSVCYFLPFYKLFNEISKHISYLDILRLIRFYPDPEESESRQNL